MDRIKWIYSVPGRSKFYVFLLMILQTASGAIGVFYALFMKDIVDNAVSGDKQGFIYSIVRIIILIVINIAFYASINRVTELAKSTIENKFKGRLFDNILKRDYAEVTAIHSGEWINRMTNDAVLVANGCVEIVPSICGMVVRMISALVLIIVIDWRIAVVMVPAGILVGLLAYACRKKLKKMHKEVQEADGKFRIFIQENIASLIMIRSFATQVQTAAEAEEKMADHKNIRMKRNLFSNMTSSGFSLAMNAMYFLGVFYGGMGILAGTITYGTLMAITQLISQIQGPIVSITGMIPRIFTITASAERLMEIEGYKKAEISNCSRDEINSYYRDTFEGIGIKNGFFAYKGATDDMPQVIENFNIDIDKGQYIAFTGHSGCGKSTVLKLIMNIYDLDSGSLYVKEGGEQVPITGPARNLFAYVPQGNLLMNGTVRDIICFSDKSRSNDEEAIDKALKIACADEFVYALEQGIDTVLKERGTGLSEGQMQRLAVARAIFSERPILILDEATSALDEVTEEKLLTNLRSMTDMTVIIVTHRKKALTICDRVFDFSERIESDD